MVKDSLGIEKGDRCGHQTIPKEVGEPLPRRVVEVNIAAVNDTRLDLGAGKFILKLIGIIDDPSFFHLCPLLSTPLTTFQIQ
jgi:hypothetical protein